MSNRAIAFARRGLAYYRLNQGALAAQDLSAAISLEPSEPEWYFQRGNVYVFLNQIDRAIADFDRAIALNPAYVDAMLQRGHAYYLKGEYIRALRDYEWVIKLRPYEAAGWRGKGGCHYYLRQYEEALRAFDSATRIDPRDYLSHNGHGQTLADQGHYERAIKDFDRAIAIKPKFAEAYANRGGVHLKLGNFDQAIADSQTALRFRLLAYAATNLRDAQAAKAALAQRQAQGPAPPPQVAPPSQPLPPVNPPPIAQPPAPRVALVIGNGRYQNVSRLANAENDAADIAMTLQALGFRVYGFPRLNFTRSEMETVIAEFQVAAASADAAFVWYAGHGQEFAEKEELGRNWLIPVDAVINRPADMYSQGISMSRLLTSAEPARTLRVVVIDACRNSNLPSATRMIGPRLAVEQRIGMMVVFSTRAGTVALDGEGRNSPFAAAFLEAARDKARLDIRQFFGAVARGTLARTRNAQEPELIVRLQTDASLPLQP